MTKICSRCATEKLLKEFNEEKNTRDVKSRWCRACYRSYNFLKYEAARGTPIPENVRNSRRVACRCWAMKNRNYSAQYKRIRRSIDADFRLLENMRSRLHQVVKCKKSATTAKLVGCSVDFLHTYLESKFKPGMDWENYGDWHVDHIKPCANFNLVDPEQQCACFHWSNLQPLWAKENISKGAKYIL